MLAGPPQSERSLHSPIYHWILHSSSCEDTRHQFLFTEELLTVNDGLWCVCKCGNSAPLTDFTCHALESRQSYSDMNRLSATVQLERLQLTRAMGSKSYSSAYQRGIIDISRSYKCEPSRKDKPSIRPLPMFYMELRLSTHFSHTLTNWTQHKDMPPFQPFRLDLSSLEH